MYINKHVALFAYHYHKALLSENFLDKEKLILKTYADNYDINISNFESPYFLPKFVEPNFNSNLCFLYNLHLTVVNDFSTDDYHKGFLIDYCSKVGFCRNTSTKELSEYLIECALLKMPFEEVLESILV